MKLGATPFRTRRAVAFAITAVPYFHFAVGGSIAGNAAIYSIKTSLFKAIINSCS